MIKKKKYCLYLFKDIP